MCVSSPTAASSTDMDDGPSFGAETEAALADADEVNDTEEMELPADDRLQYAGGDELVESSGVRGRRYEPTMRSQLWTSFSQTWLQSDM